MIERRMMPVILSLLALAMSGFAQTPAPQGKGSLADLSWLSGCWEGRQGEAHIEEHWSKPSGGSMIGFGRTVKVNKTTTFEFMQFREQDGNLVFLPQPAGGARVAFPLKDSFSSRFTFENKEHDFPQRVIYERKGPGLLLATVEGTYKGKEEREEFQMKKVRCSE